MRIKNKSRITVFILSLIAWLALTSFTDLQELAAGVITALIISRISGHFLITTKKTASLFNRILSFIKYLFVFSWEMIKANFHVAYIVVHPDLPVKPGIVKIKTALTKDSGRTVLANSITLTPGTMTVDINDRTNEIYIHWIDVQSADPHSIQENSKRISGRFEPILEEVFE